MVDAARLLQGRQALKLSGGGRGGNMIALVTPAAAAQPVAAALQAAGAVRTIHNHRSACSK
jgi:mevalonate kinase